MVEQTNDFLVNFYVENVLNVQHFIKTKTKQMFHWLFLMVCGMKDQNESFFSLTVLWFWYFMHEISKLFRCLMIPIFHTTPAYVCCMGHVFSIFHRGSCSPSVRGCGTHMSLHCFLLFSCRCLLDSFIRLGLRSFPFLTMKKRVPCRHFTLTSAINKGA